MSMQEFYDEMKAVLKYFGLAFIQMDLVTITIDGEKVIFKYGRMSVHINCAEDEE